MGFEQKVNQYLNGHPKIKKGIKRVYQRISYALSKKTKAQGDIIEITPDDGKEYFFGYYDKSPWDASGRFMLCLRAADTWSDVSPRSEAEILIIDTQNNNSIKTVARTGTWNVQQGCMAQWLGPDHSSRIIYNDIREGKYVSVILDIESGQERVLDTPVYTVSDDGKTALSLDFSRLYELRPGYGYYNVAETTKGVPLPDSWAVYRLDIESGETVPLLKYTDLASFAPRAEMLEPRSVHKVNHLMLSPDGKRFMMLYRWFVGTKKYTRLITCNTDGTDMYLLSDDDMVSHCFWKDNEYILAFENKKGTGAGYYLMKDRTGEYVRLWDKICGDGHPSYSPDRKNVVTDSYPDKKRMQYIKILAEGEPDGMTVARVFAPFKYDNETRCDLHPRWSRDGKKICFDGAFNGHRGLYVVDVSECVLPVLADNESRTEIEEPKYSVITPMYNSFALMTRYFNSLTNQTYKNFEVIIIDDCSTDGSYESLCEYVKKTPLTIRVFRSDKNEGPGAARNIGIDMAKGEWMTFIDNDDWIENTLFEKIEEIVSSRMADAVIFDYYTTNGIEKKRGSSMYHGTHGMVSLSECVSYTRNHTWGKVYRTSRCKDNSIYFPHLRRCEDVAFVARALVACENVFYLDEPLYNYFRRSSSLSNNRSLGETDMVNAFAIIEKELSGRFPKEIEQKSVSDILYGALLMMCKSGRANKEIRDYINNYEKKYPGWSKSEIISYLGKGKSVFLKFAKVRFIAGMKAIANVHSLLTVGKKR